MVERYTDHCCHQSGKALEMKVMLRGMKEKKLPEIRKEHIKVLQQLRKQLISLI
jgi:hypothetical protein